MSYRNLNTFVYLDGHVLSVGRSLLINGVSGEVRVDMQAYDCMKTFKISNNHPAMSFPV